MEVIDVQLSFSRALKQKTAVNVERLLYTDENNVLFGFHCFFTYIQDTVNYLRTERNIETVWIILHTGGRSPNTVFSADYGPSSLENWDLEHETEEVQKQQTER